MKGSLAPRTAISLAIAVIVIAVALYFLVFASSLKGLFLSSDVTKLKQYSTCVLAYCAAGAGSDEVNAVGCLERKDGQCVLSCADVEQKIYKKNTDDVKDDVKPTITEFGGRGADHYCGPAAELEFEFDGPNFGGAVQLYSGQMDKISKKPEWVCKPFEIPGLGIEVDSIPGLHWTETAGAQHTGFGGAVPQNCIILSGRAPVEGISLVPGRGGCFQPIKYDESWESIYYTPIIEYDSPAQIIYPSAIYVDSSFTDPLEGALAPECDYRNEPNKNQVGKEDVTQRVSQIINSPHIPLGDPSGSDNLVGNVLNKCGFKERWPSGEKMIYRVWAKPVYPNIDALKEASGGAGFKDYIDNLLGHTSTELFVAFQLLTLGIESTEESAKLVASQLAGSCTAVVLTRDSEGLDQTEESSTAQAGEKTTEIFGEDFAF